MRWTGALMDTGYYLAQLMVGSSVGMFERCKGQAVLVRTPVLSLICVGSKVSTILSLVFHLVLMIRAHSYLKSRAPSSYQAALTEMSRSSRQTTGHWCRRSAAIQAQLPASTIAGTASGLSVEATIAQSNYGVAMMARESNVRVLLTKNRSG